MNGWPSIASLRLVNEIRFAASILEDAELVGPKPVPLRIRDLALQLRSGLFEAAGLRRLALRRCRRLLGAPLPRRLTEAKKSRQQAHADAQVLWPSRGYGVPGGYPYTPSEQTDLRHRSR